MLTVAVCSTACSILLIVSKTKSLDHVEFSIKMPLSKVYVKVMGFGQLPIML
jgi:hypothetical protein